jgi:hypothetical protein
MLLAIAVSEPIVRRLAFSWSRLFGSVAFAPVPSTREIALALLARRSPAQPAIPIGNRQSRRACVETNACTRS